MTNRRLATVLAGTILASGAAAAQEAPAGVTPPKTSVVPVLSQHRKPGPFPILPMWDLGWTPGEFAYRLDKLRPGGGALDSVMNSAAPVKLGGGYTSAGSTKEAFGQASYRSAEATIQATGAYENAGRYADGNDEEVRTGYDRHTKQLSMMFRPSPDASIQAMVLHDRIDDNMLPVTSTVVQNGLALAEGFGADPIRTDRTLGLLAAETTKPTTGLDKLKFEMRYTGLERRADNYTLRPDTASTSRNIARPSRQEFGGAVTGESTLADDVAARLSLSTKRIWHDAQRWGGPATAITQTTGFQYPGIEAWENVAAMDLAWKPAAATSLNLGLRYEYTTLDATKIDNAMNIGTYSGSPRALYQAYYGGTADAQPDFHLPSIKLDGEQKFAADRVSLTGSLGRIMRAPDTQELFFALPSTAVVTTSATNTVAGTATRQVGNPGLDPETHYRAEAGVAVKGDDWIDYGRKRPGGDDGLGSQSWRLSLSGYVDQVQDFVTRDRAHGQSGVLLSDNAAIRRNTDARLAGVDIDAAVNLTRNWSTRLALAYRWGENTADGRALYGIDPLEANWLVDYQDRLGEIGTWNAGFKVRAVARQGRQDLDPTAGSGYDAESRGGFGLFDLYAGMQVHDAVGLRLGIDNVFDKTFAEANPANTTDETNPSSVNGPGRSFYARAVATF